MPTPAKDTVVIATPSVGRVDSVTDLNATAQALKSSAATVRHVRLDHKDGLLKTFGKLYNNASPTPASTEADLVIPCHPGEEIELCNATGYSFGTALSASGSDAAGLSSADPAAQPDLFVGSE